jgi:hypothetical protein
MHKSVQVRWIEYAERRSLRELAALQRATSEPHVSIVYAKSGSAWFGWLRELGRPLGRPLAATRLSLAEMTVPAQPHCAAVVKVASADLDDDRSPAAVTTITNAAHADTGAEHEERSWTLVPEAVERASMSVAEAGSPGSGMAVLRNDLTRIS